MIGLSLTDSTRAAALDGSLSFSILLQNQRELTVGTAQSSVNGLLTAILSAPADYARLLEVNDSTVTAQATSASKLSQPAWTAAPDATQTAISNYLEQQLEAEIATAENQVSSATSQATAAKNSATKPSTEYDLAASLETSGNQLLSGLSDLQANQDSQAAQTIASAKTQISSTLQDAQSHLASLLAQNPQPAAQIAATQAVISAAQGLLVAAGSAETVSSSTLAGPAGQPAASYQLTTDTSPTTYLTTWGDSGAVTLTDATGKGIIITSDGKVDTIPPSGSGWQFANDSTFLLPDGTKVTVSPGSPASVLATRGQQQIAITDLAPGQSPTTTLSKTGGLAADAARNDGYIFTMGADQQSWTLSGATLGNPNGPRETVATTPLANEYAVDVTNVPIDPALVAALQTLGIDATAFDANKDGKFSNKELQTLVAAVDALVVGAQHKFDAAIASGTTASQSLLKLNQFLEKVLADADRRQESREKVSAEERDQLLQIQKDLESAREGLRHVQRQNAPQGENARNDTRSPDLTNNTNLLAVARVVLNQIGNFGSSPAPIVPGKPDQDASTTNVPEGPSGTRQLSPTIPGSTVSQALRRAERLLSGLSGGTSSRKFQEALGDGTSKSTLGATTPTAPFGGQPSAPLPSANLPTLPLDQLSNPPSVVLPESTLVPDATDNTRVQDGRSARNAPVSQEPPDFNQPLPRSNQVQSPGSFQPASEKGILNDLSRAASGQAPEPFANAITGGALQPPVVPPPPPTTPVANDAAQVPPTPPSGLTPLPGTRFPATGPDASVAPDPTFGAPDGFAREFRRRVDEHLSTYRAQTAQAQQLQTEVRTVVERFVTLVGQDDELRQVFNAADLSDAQKADLKSKVQDLERNLGVTWGGDPAKTPQGEASLNARVFTSGMMI